MAGKAERRPPVQAAYLNLHASGAVKDGGIPVSAVIDDAHSSAPAKDPDGLTQSPGAFFTAMDVAEGQVADHHIERAGRKGEISRIGSYELDTLADTLDHRVALGGGPGVPRLVAQAPDVGSGCAALGEAAGSRDEDGTAAAADVEHVLVASQIEFIEQLLPDRQLARTCAVEVARSDCEHGHNPHLRQEADKALASSAGPPLTSKKTGFDKEEVRNADVSSVDAVSGSISPHPFECASSAAVDRAQKARRLTDLLTRPVGTGETT